MAYKELKERLDQLREHMLPEIFDPTKYDEKVKDMARGYVVLAHAEIEAFIETIVCEIIDRDLNQMKTKKELSKTLLCISAYCHDVNQRNYKEAISTKVGRATKLLLDYIKTTNNGIKEDNLVKMLKPLGINIDDLDITWVANMNSFGSNRGAHAHTSGSKRDVDPKTEYDNVEGLMNGLLVLEETIMKLNK